MPKPYYRSSLIHFACIGVALPQLFMPRAFCMPFPGRPFACGVTSQGGATPIHAKRIKLDLTVLHHAIFENRIQ